MALSQVSAGLDVKFEARREWSDGGVMGSNIIIGRVAFHPGMPCRLPFAATSL
jgi:hypothetical protein